MHVLPSPREVGNREGGVYGSYAEIQEECGKLVKMVFAIDF
jgi:hypothetical protein